MFVFTCNQTSTMNALALLNIFVLVPSISYALVCTGRADGNYEVSCRAYAICSGGISTLHNCQSNYVYNNVTKTCEDPSKVGAPCGLVEDCHNSPNRRYADKKNGLGCHSYYTCQNGVYFGHNLCSPGLVFDESMQTCNWPNNVAPPCGTKTP